MTFSKITKIIIAVLFFGLPFFAYAENASLYLRPASGLFSVGSTFELGIYLNTGGNNINAIKADLSFPPDKLQVVSPSLGKSIIALWVVQPTFSNSRGSISFEGGIPPPGVNTTDGLISTVVFRVMQPGQASITVNDGSRVYLADGKGTNILGSRSDAIFSLLLPSPQGPVVVAPKHSDPNKWYQDDDVEFVWEMPAGATKVSYILNDEPVATPDDIAESDRTSIAYKDLPSGTHYFHVKALNPSAGWGGTSHFLVNIDDEPPADFLIEVSPRPKTVTRRPTLLFATTDKHSGLSHYLLKIIRTDISDDSGQNSLTTPFFIQVSSPVVVPELDFGKFTVVVRAYDFAANFKESQQKVTISRGFFRNVGPDGINFRGNIVLSWGVIYSILSVFCAATLYFAHFFYRGHREVERRLAAGVLNFVEKRITERLRILQQKREEYENNKLEKK